MAIDRSKSSTKKIEIGKDLSITQENHLKLLNHIKNHLDFAQTLRAAEVQRYETIDKELMGYVSLDDEDKAREKDNKKEGAVKPTKTVLPLTLTQMQELVTYLMTIFAPDTGMYGAIAPADKQDIAKAFSLVMNRHADKFKHFGAYVKACFDIVRYNKGGIIVEWDEIHGNKIKGSQANTSVEITNELIFAGNNVKAIDQYNFLYDISIPITEISTRGEFFATVDVVKSFTVKKRGADKKLFIKDLKLESLSSTTEYYQKKPDIFIDHSGAVGNIIDWVGVMTMGDDKQEHGGIEIITYYGWLIPKDFGLSASEEYQIWKITLISDKHIVLAQHMNNAHGMLPVSLGRAFPDGFENQSKAIAELLFPYQRIGSFMLNSYVESVRKGIYGLNIYNKLVIPDFDTFQGASGSYPAAAPTKDFDLRKAFLHINTAPDVSNTLQNINMIHDLMQLIQPTDINRQVASLERATQYQAAAVVQGGHRKNGMLARLIDIDCFGPSRHMMMYNILQFQETMDVINEQGERQAINPSEFREASDDLDLTPGGGLINIDKLIITEGLRDIIGMILQSPTVSDRIDIVKLIDYWSSMIGDNTDFKLFLFDTPFDKLTLDQKQVAFDLLQQAVTAQQEGGEAANV